LRGQLRGNLPPGTASPKRRLATAVPPCVLRGPGDVEWAAVEQDQNDGLAEGGYCFEKFLLLAGQIERGAGRGFATHVLNFAKGEDGEVGVAGEGKGLVELGPLLVFGPVGGVGLVEDLVEEGGEEALDLDALCVIDVGVGA